MRRERETRAAALAAAALAAYWLAARDVPAVNALLPGRVRTDTGGGARTGDAARAPAGNGSADEWRDAVGERPPGAAAPGRRSLGTILRRGSLGAPGAARPGAFAGPQGDSSPREPLPPSGGRRGRDRGSPRGARTDRKPQAASALTREGAAAASSSGAGVADEAAVSPARGGTDARGGRLKKEVGGESGGSSVPASNAPSSREGSSPLFAGRDADFRGSSWEARGGRGRRFRPLLLSKLLGRRPLRPPPARLKAPAALARLDKKRPAAALSAALASLGAVEEIDPASLPRDRRSGAHWDGTQWHSGRARGVTGPEGWTWLYRDGPRWWALAEGGEPLLREDGVWWTRREGAWYVLHDGQPWAWRPFHDWNAQGLLQMGSGTEMVYSQDFKKVAVVSPGEGAEVFDAETGALLERIPQVRMPARRRPNPLRNFTVPADVFVR